MVVDGNKKSKCCANELAQDAMRENQTLKGQNINLKQIVIEREII